MKLIRWLLFAVLTVITSIIILLGGNTAKSVMAQSQLSEISPVAEVPEEILRTEIILSARSPLDGKIVTAAEYIELQKQLQASPAPSLNANIQDQIFLLRIRRAILQFLPFLNI